MALTKTTFSMTSGAVVNVFDFMTPAQIADVQAGYAAQDVTIPIQNAINSLGTAGGVVKMPAGQYKTTDIINLKSGVTLSGEGNYGSTPVSPSTIRYGATSILGAHTKSTVLSLQGAIGCTVENLSIDTNTGVYPKTGLVLGRSTTASSGFHNIRKVTVIGTYSVAAVYSIASEVNLWEDLTIWIFGGGAKYCFYTSERDDLNVGPSLIQSTNLDNVFILPCFINAANDANAACIKINCGVYTGSWTFLGAYLTAYSGSYVEIANGYIDTYSSLGPISFISCSGERLAGGDPIYGYRLTAAVGCTLSNLNIIGGRFDFLAGTSHYLFSQDSNLFLSQPNITLTPPEAFPYAQVVLYRSQIYGGTVNLGRYAAWQAATFASGWSSALGSPYPVPSYMIDSTGRVHLRGTVTGGTGTIMTLPVGYRPYYTWRLPTQSNGAVALITVDSSGVVSLVSGSATNVELGNLSFDMTSWTLA
jgi:hypothetical protein